jgi:signal transduction histidine kinase
VGGGAPARHTPEGGIPQGGTRAPIALPSSLMHPFEEMKAYVGFGDEDRALLEAFWPEVQPRVAAIVDVFYDRILATPAARSVLADEQQVQRLKTTLQRWLEELLRGPHDLAYYERRTRIGRVHVDVKLPSRFMYTAMSVIRNELCAIAHDDRPHSLALCSAIDRVTSLDLAIMTGTYIEERELQTLSDVLVSHLPVNVLLVDRDGRVVSATRHGPRLFGMGDVLGRHWTEAVPTGLLEAGQLAEQVAYAEQTGREVALMRIDVTMDGRPRSFRATVVPLDHPLAALLLHFEELTDALEAEARLQRSETLARLGEMSAAVAHELRNPLAGISGALQRITKTMPADDRRKPIMEKVEQQVRRLDALVSDLLAFARPERARMSEVALPEAAKRALEQAAAEMPDLTARIEGEGTAWADPNLLQHILVNLIENGAQATQGKGNVLVRVSPGRVLIADDGPGVSADDRQRIFQPFFTTRTRGTGLGLPVSLKAAAAMGAEIALLDSGPLPGAAFEVRLRTEMP